ncbi:MAG: type III polyketide synthase [Sandaracinus sp.]|nr:type III polyketide synthase [Sandaracinus sp.]|tara:strand:+ start:513 stop:1643 length:1131 start_codon:yes stop_codon:yes gene_type:complete
MTEPVRALVPAPKAPAIGGTGKALPPHRHDQTELAQLSLELFPALAGKEEALARFFRRVGVEGRNLALPAAEYRELDGLGARNDAWLRVAMDLATEATTRALADAGLQASDIDQIITTTVTGIAVPSIDARLVNRLDFRTDVKRVPLFGLGCLGGAAGIARAADYLAGHPDQAVLLVSVELCSLTLQRDDVSTKNLIATGLFGDGAAALVMRGPEHRARGASDEAPTVLRRAAEPKVVDSRSVFFPDTERTMGWDVRDTGFEVVLAPNVPKLVAEHVPGAIDELLAAHGLDRGDVSTWVSHPGGPAVIAALEEGLELEPEALAPTRAHLAEVGNLSSSSVLFLLDEARRSRPEPGSHGVLLAMGPGFCAELVLLQW